MAYASQQFSLVESGKAIADTLIKEMLDTMGGRSSRPGRLDLQRQTSIVRAAGKLLAEAGFDYVSSHVFDGALDFAFARSNDTVVVSFTEGRGNDSFGWLATRSGSLREQTGRSIDELHELLHPVNERAAALPPPRHLSVDVARVMRIAQRYGYRPGKLQPSSARMNVDGYRRTDGHELELVRNTATSPLEMRHWLPNADRDRGPSRVLKNTGAAVRYLHVLHGSSPVRKPARSRARG